MMTEKREMTQLLLTQMINQNSDDGGGDDDDIQMDNDSKER